MKLLGAGAGLLGLVILVAGQQPTPVDPQKANNRPGMPARRAAAEPYDDATAERMNSQCVTLQTAEGNIEIEMYADAAPETVRNFLNLSAIGAFDTTVFSRVVKDFVIQGGNLSTHENMTQALADRSHRTIMDEPNFVKHERGIVSMARPKTPNGATTNFFILVSSAPFLDGTFTAFAHVRNGLDVVDRINQAPLDGEKPVKPVRITRAVVANCSK